MVRVWRGVQILQVYSRDQIHKEAVQSTSTRPLLVLSKSANVIKDELSRRGLYSSTTSSVARPLWPHFVASVSATATATATPLLHFSTSLSSPLLPFPPLPSRFPLHL